MGITKPNCKSIIIFDLLKTEKEKIVKT